MKAYSIFDWNVAEPMYRFVSQEKIYSDFEKKSITEDLAIIDYVYTYKRKEFNAYCIKNYGFSVYYDDPQFT